MTNDTPLWTPSPERARATAIAQLADRQGFNGDDAIAQLWQWSVANPADFWQLLWNDFAVRASAPADQVLVEGDDITKARWFVGARLSYAENLLRRDDEGEAVVFWSEEGQRRALSWRQLRQQVAALAAALKQAGVGVGDRVVADLPNMPEAVIGLLASNAVGAIWSSCSPDFGVSGVLDRFGQVEPKVLISVDGYRYNGKAIDIRPKVAEIAQQLPSLVQTVIVPFLEADPAIGAIPNAVTWDAFLVDEPPPLTFEQLPFDHPLYILYSSGTTGKPKAIVHGAGSALLQHLKEHRLHTDLRPGDRLFYFTTCGWMMWNWLVSALASEVTIVLFDGSPFYPDAGLLWQMAEQERLTAFGTSAKYIDALAKNGYSPGTSYDLSPLKAVLSTGSPLSPEGFDYVYREIKGDLQLSSISGGTDIVSCFVLGNPAGAVYRGEIQMRGLGMAVEVWNDKGQAVQGEKGELVCTQPFPSMPVKFWNDPHGERYYNSYFARFDNVWCHGDFAELTLRGGVIIYGRSDAVLNPGGVRIGTAEIYRQVEKIDAVLESICIGQEWDNDVRVVLFVVLREGFELDDALRDQIKKQIRSHCSPRHVPAKIIQVADIPRTRNNKIMELAVREVVHGKTVKNTEALANPNSLEYYRNLPELQN